MDQTLKVLGLSRCQHTIVGNALLRGISGGEKKRLTTAEMTGGQVNVLLMDSISTGLDSAATFDICKTLSICTQALQANIVVCLLQPPPEVFDLFDDVILMDSGMYLHGCFVSIAHSTTTYVLCCVYLTYKQSHNTYTCRTNRLSWAT